MNLQQKKLKNSNTCRKQGLLVCGLLLASVMKVTAADDIPAPPAEGTITQDQSAVQAPAPLPPTEHPSDDSRNLPQPEVRIIHRDDGTIEEYSIGGQVRYVKIIPKKGKPYYLVDHDGDGVLESRHGDLKGVPNINQWIIKQW